jgi:GDSL/SGNH-like Acyl-Esterase family found in Pmr5 and Cas1p
LWTKLDSAPMQSNSYQWNVTDANCTLEPFSITKFCSILNGRSILFVGDSISAQYYRVMMKLFNTETKIEQSLWKYNHSVSTQQSAQICLNGSYIRYVRNDHLSTSITVGATGATPSSIGSNIITPWMHLLKYHQILILNTGAHTQRSGNQYRQNLYDVKKAIADKNYTGQVYFRTTPRGHISCSNNVNKGPIKVNDTNWNQFFVNFTTNVTYQKYNEVYRYVIIPEYNRLLRKIMGPSSVSSPLLSKDNNSNSWKVLDMAPLLELRPDVHECYIEDWLHIDMSKQIVLQFFWQLLFNAMQGYV